MLTPDNTFECARCAKQVGSPWTLRQVMGGTVGKITGKLQVIWMCPGGGEGHGYIALYLKGDLEIAPETEGGVMINLPLR